MGVCGIKCTHNLKQSWTWGIWCNRSFDRLSDLNNNRLFYNTLDQSILQMCMSQAHVLKWPQMFNSENILHKLVIYTVITVIYTYQVAVITCDIYIRLQWSLWSFFQIDYEGDDLNFSLIKFYVKHTIFHQYLCCTMTLWMSSKAHPVLQAWRRQHKSAPPQREVQWKGRLCCKFAFVASPSL